MQLQYCIILNVPSSVSNFRREVPAIAPIKMIITTETPPATAQYASFRMFSFVEMFVEWTTERLLQADRVNRKSFYVNIEAKVRLVTCSWKGGNIKCFRYRVPKCDVIKNEICEIMGFVKLFWKNNVQDAYLPKISYLGQIVSEILAQICSDDSIQILLNLTWFLILWTTPNLEGFVWNRHSITGLISQRQFAPNC